MKRKLLFAATMISGLSFGQFTQTNEPAIGALVDYFLCDSNVTNYDAMTGTGVTWDYSTIAGVTGIQKLTDVIDASTSSNYADFPGSTKATNVQSAITTFFTSDATTRTSQGFIFNEPTFGEVKAKFSVDPQITHNYPMVLGDEVTDNFSGNLSFMFSGLPQNPACTGISHAWVDGAGTLLLAGNTYPNILRYKLVDTAYTTVIILGDLEVIRTQYEYYDLANGTLPLFTHTNIKIQAPGATDPLTAQTLVLSKDQPTAWLAVDENELSTVELYPNPATETIAVKGITGTSSINIIDHSGRIVRSFNEVYNGQVLSLNGLESGMYHMQINSAEAAVLKAFVKK